MVDCCCSVSVRVVGLLGLGGGTGGRSLWAGFGGGIGRGLSASLFGGNRAIFGERAAGGGDAGLGLLTGGRADFSLDFRA